MIQESKILHQLQATNFHKEQYLQEKWTFASNFSQMLCWYEMTDEADK
jgi:hypothetical protein